MIKASLCPGFSLDMKLQDVDTTIRVLERLGEKKGVEFMRKIVNSVILICYIKMMAFLRCRISIFGPKH